MLRAPQVALQRHKVQAHITHQVVAVEVARALLAMGAQAVLAATTEPAAAAVAQVIAP